MHFQKAPRAAFISLDNHISHAEALKHTHWVYALRLLKASFQFQAGAVHESSMIENLRSVKSLADHKMDPMVRIVASILEAVAHLRARKDDYLIRVKTCVAEASKYQCADLSAHIPQVDILLMLLKLCCNLHEKNSEELTRQLTAMAQKMDTMINSPDWDGNKPDLVIPIHKQSGQPISDETSTILKPGSDGPSDYLILSYMSKLESFVVA